LLFHNIVLLVGYIVIRCNLVSTFKEEGYCYGIVTKYTNLTITRTRPRATTEYIILRTVYGIPIRRELWFYLDTTG